jgi:hypothetical protein
MDTAMPTVLLLEQNALKMLFFAFSSLCHENGRVVSEKLVVLHASCCGFDTRSQQH